MKLFARDARFAVPAIVVTTTLVLPSILSAAPNLTGRWKAVLTREEQTREYYLDIVHAKNRISGALISPRTGSYPITEAVLEEDELVIAVDRKFEENTRTYRIAGKVKSDREVDAALTVGDRRYGSMKLTKIGNPLGQWKTVATIGDDGRTLESSLSIRATDAGFAGQSKSERGERDAEKVEWREQEQLHIEFRFERDGNEMVIHIGATFDGPNSLKGRWEVEGADASGEWKATRDAEPETPKLAGVWETAAETENDTYNSQLTIRETAAGLSARYKGEPGEVDYKSAAFKDGELRLELELEIEGNPVAFVIRAKIQDDGSLKGRWNVRDNEEASGNWSARRKAEEAKPDAPQKRRVVEL